MLKYKISLLLLLVSFGVAVFGAAAMIKRPAQKKDSPPRIEIDKEQWPLVEYDAPEPADAQKRKQRRAKSARYNDEGVTVREPGSEPGVTYVSITINDWEVGLPALPVRASDSVLIGEVTSAQAFLSNDKSGIYSEFVIRVSEVLQNRPLSHRVVPD